MRADIALGMMMNDGAALSAAACYERGERQRQTAIENARRCEKIEMDAIAKVDQWKQPDLWWRILRRMDAARTALCKAGGA